VVPAWQDRRPLAVEERSVRLPVGAAVFRAAAVKEGVFREVAEAAAVRSVGAMVAAGADMEDE
jgi:hypothetical protein